MCFSAEASFAGGAVISAIGVAALKRVQKPPHIAFASIPFLFGIQQFSEGAVWLALSNPTYGPLQDAGMYLFLFMARVVWPALIPVSVLLMEVNRERRKWLRIFVAMGFTIALYYTYCLLFLNVAPGIEGNHIRYVSDFPEAPAVPVFIVYFVASLAPLFVSSVNRTKLFGVALFISAGITVMYFSEYVTSVWCFFAAGLSGMVLWIIRGVKKSGLEHNTVV